MCRFSVPERKDWRLGTSQSALNHHSRLDDATPPDYIQPVAPGCGDSAADVATACMQLARVTSAPVMMQDAILRAAIRPCCTLFVLAAAHSEPSHP